MLRMCGRCQTEKPLEDFAWRRIDKGWRDSYCRPCRAVYKQSHYAKNKQRYVDQASERNRAVLEDRTRYLIDFFKTNPCVDCGESDPVVLEFDHTSDDKDFTIGSGIRNRSWRQVLDEINKCEVVCVNCHRRRTAKRAGFYRTKWAVTKDSKASKEVRRPR